MRVTRQTCEPMLLNRFIDKEVDSAEFLRVNEHIKHCSACRCFVSASRRISALVNDGISDAVGQARLKSPDRVAVNLKRKKTWRAKIVNGFFPKRVVATAAAIIALIILAFAALFSMNNSEPGVIIAAIEGDMASVMIMETPDTHHTIIWFKEAAHGPGKNKVPARL